MKAILFALCLRLVWGAGPQVSIPGLGTVEGDVSESWVAKRPIYQFKGIPFATPPIGNLRFQPPQPVDPWDGVWDATRMGRFCPQHLVPAENSTDFKALTDDPEDCLYTHVYTPTLDPSAKLPVMVFIHGGKFIIGFAHLFGSERLLDKDVILVVPHYRLGPLGFLSLQSDAIPGNAGMLDQVAALQWVKQYISAFGGDPDSITVMGQSAGATSSALLNVSPLSTGLFQRYISESGSAAASWAIDNDPLYAANQIGRLAGCADLSVAALAKCFSNMDVDTMLNAHSTFLLNEGLAGRPDNTGATAPVVQTAGTVRFLEKHPRQILEEGSYTHKPALLGANKHEGTLTYAIYYQEYFEPNDLLNNSAFFGRELTNTLMKNYGISNSGEAISAGIEKAYFGQENMGNSTAMTPGLIDFFGAMKFKGVIYDQAKYNSKFNNDTYVYAFHYQGEASLCAYTNVVPGGVCHSAELVFLFKIPLIQLNAEEEELSKKMIDLWTNFAIYGNPTPMEKPVSGVPSWPTFDQYLRIDSTFSVMNGDYTINEYFVSRNEGFPW